MSQPDPDKVRVIHNGIDAEQYAPDPDTDAKLYQEVAASTVKPADA